MRCFLAVPIPQMQKSVILEGLRRLQVQLPKARWVKPEGLHITLKFLGDLAEEKARDLVQRLRRFQLSLPSAVEVSLRGGGFFPDVRRARVAWIGGAAPGLEDWAFAAAQVAEEFGVAPEGRAFALHVTLARLERPWPQAASQRFLQEVGNWELAPFLATEIVLFESTLQPSGAVYTEKARISMGYEG